MSLQLRIFPAQTRAKILTKFKQQHGNNLIPVILFFHQQKIWNNFKQYMLVAIEPHNCLFQFIKIIELKLVWNGYLSQKNRTLFMSINQKQLNPSSELNMKDIYQKHKKEDGWLEITLLSVSAFG